MKNSTKNQHFISQVEQRLNSSNPEAEKTNQKIYSFSIKNRETFDFRLKSKHGTTIKNNLSLGDLFSFNLVQDSDLRSNFEDLFGQYESTIQLNTVSLLDKLKIKDTNIHNEIIDIFCAKLLNFFRNPFSIRKILASLPPLINMCRIANINKSEIEIIINGKRPQQKYLCSQLSISEDEYEKWLCCLYVLLNRNANEFNAFEMLVKSLFESVDTCKMVFIYTYKNSFCALSDRGFIESLPNPHLSLDFNLHKHAFIRYSFGDIRELAKSFSNEKQLEKYISMSAGSKQNLNIIHKHDDISELVNFNKNSILQSKHHVYCADKNIITKT